MREIVEPDCQAKNEHGGQAKSAYAYRVPFANHKHPVEKGSY
jgi:hypothetical protein